MSIENDSIVTDESAQHNEADTNPVDMEQHESSSDEVIDVSEEEAQVDPRAARLSEIASNVRKGREVDRDDESLDDESLSKQSSDEEPAPGPQDLESPVIEREGKFFVKAQVNGEEREIPWDQAIRSIQINEAADQRLNAAALKEKELNLKEEQLNARHQASQQPPAQPAMPSVQDASVQKQQKELARRYRESLMEGEEEQADQIMVEMSNLGRSPATPAIDPNQIAQSAAERVVQQNEQTRRINEAKSANQAFETEYSDIANDPNLFSLAKNNAKKIWDKEPYLTPSEVTDRTGQDIRRWKNDMQAPSTKEGRQQRKRSASAKTVSGNNQAAKLKQEPAPPKTRSQHIADMRKERPGASG